MLKKGLLAVIAVAIAVTISTPRIAKGSTSTEIKNKMEQNKEKIEDLNNNKNKISEDKKSKQQDLDKLQGDINNKNKELLSSQSKLDTYRNEIKGLQENINSIENELYQVEASIKQKEEDIKKKEQEKKEKEEHLAKRLRNIYKTNYQESMFFVLVESQSLGSLLSNINILSKVVKADKAMIEEVENIAKELQIDKENLNKKVSYLNTEKAQVVKMQDEVKVKEKGVAEETAKLQGQMDSLKELEGEKQKVIDDLTSQEKKVEGEIDDLNSYDKNLQSQLDNIFKNINNAGNSSSSGSSNTGGSSNSGVQANNSQGFIRPASGYVSCPYGPRIHPVTKVYGIHTGIDLAAGMGSPIIAAKSGKVVTASYLAAYGNTVIIDHGGGYQTLYAHASAFNVTVGQTVTQGQVIAKVGSTGYSTGPHLHFEIRVNGQHVNPANYMNF